MHRLVALLRWRTVRWIFCAAAVPALWACNSRKLVAPVGGPSAVVQQQFQQSVNRDLDILFMIDNSSSMAPLQTKLAAQLPTFMQVLTPLRPNLHVAVISSSLGAGVFSNVPGCGPGTVGNEGGAFQHDIARCGSMGWHTGEKFLISSNDPNNPNGPPITNFDGDIATVFGCIALLGDQGCGFEHQFASTIAALQKAQNPNDADNGGFLRSDAFLAIVMLTNEDDCSAPPSSTLFDPSQFQLSDPLGGLQSYRCNEFGHLCDPGKTPPPHAPPAAPTTLTGCTSSEGMSPPVDPNHELIKVSDFVAFLNSLKPGNPDKILVAALAGPVTPYTVEGHSFPLPNGDSEVQPWMVHSCTSGTDGTEYADPGVRIKNWLDAFGTNGLLESICAPTFATALTTIAQAISKKLSQQCISGTILPKTDGSGNPDCDVALTKFDAAGKATSMKIPFCDAANSVVPCWRLAQDGMACPSTAQKPSQRLDVCYDAGCTATARPQTEANAVASCAIAP